MDKLNFFSADYRDGRVHIGGKSYPAGTFATHLLNRFYENDTAARIAVYTTDNWQTENMLRLGYINTSDFVKTGERLGYLKGKSALLIFQRWGNMKFAYRNHKFWCKGYYIDTVGKNTKAIKSYISEQLKRDKETDQLSLFDPRDPFTGE